MCKIPVVFIILYFNQTKFSWTATVISRHYSFYGVTAPSEPGLPRYRSFTYTLKYLLSVGLLWMSDQPDAENSTWQNTTLTRDRHPCSRQESNPQSQQPSGPIPHGHYDRHIVTNISVKFSESVTCRSDLFYFSVHDSDMWVPFSIHFSILTAVLSYGSDC
jgi:hypothetical protein